MAVSQSLTLTEVSGSVNLSANTSKVRILWQSTQTGESWNGYTKTAKYYVSINGGAEKEYSVSYTLPQSATATILDTTITVTHNGDGSGSVKVRTWMNTGISAGVVEKTQSLTLTTIPRASTLSSASNRTLGGTCIVKWTPLSQSFRYKLKFAIGSFSYTTGAIHPNTTAAYTYTGYTLSIADIAPQIKSNPPTGTMTVTLYTYSDSGATTQIGSASSKTFTVTVPDNETTKPKVTMTLSPVTPYEKFASLYIQGRSKVKATFSGEGEYGASISSYSMQADGVNYSSPYTSDILKKSGSVSVVGTAKDSRGFSNTISKSINVISYEAPYIAPSAGYKKVICERCTEDGTASDTGTYLHIKGTRNYTKINTNGIVNTCSVRCRYKPEGGSWSHDSGSGVGVLLWTDTSTDSFDVVLPNIVTDITISYMVELNIIDDTYLPSTMIFSIPSESIDFELREGGKGAAFGKHSTKNLLECEWDAQFNNVSYLNSLYLIEKEITIDGDKDTYYPVHIEPVLLEKYTEVNTQPAFLGLGKTLNSRAGDWEGNHSTAHSSSISAAWLFRYMGWDGNGEYIIPLYKRETYAKVLAHIEGLNQATKGIVLYLRGGGATYRLVCSIPFTPKVYLTETNISVSSDPVNYPVMVTPRQYEGNKGICFSNGIVSDFVIEEAQKGIWYYRKWYSGRAECWGTTTITTSFTTAWGSLYVCPFAERQHYPFAFVDRPIESVTMRTSGAACFAFAESGGGGLNTKTQTAKYSAARPTAATEQFTVYIDYHIHGRWK